MSSTQASTSEAAIERVKRFYKDEICFEREVVVKSLRITAITTFVIGGLVGREETNRRLQVHTTGLTFPSPSARIIRSWDYKMLSFMKNGFRWAAKASLLIGSITMGITHLTLYKDRFSGWYAPAVSGSLSYIAHRACGIYAFPLGFYGSLQASTLGIIAGSTMSATVFLYSLYIDGTMDDAYRDLKKQVEKELLDLKIYQANVTKIMKERNLWFTFQALRYLKNIETDANLGSLDDYNEEEKKQEQQINVQPKK